MRDRMVQRTRLSIDGSSFILTPSEDIDDLGERLTAAVATGGSLVTFTTTDDRLVRALITPRSRVLIIDEDVAFEAEQSVLSLSSSGDWDLL
ncbi:hypothetical protein ACIPV2_00840 [Microbacterium sp. NPDC089987]|uniref:hypothetical protein n=1 Tax=Microbacterium sp. NPDC089987 TaxID=3364202 RepID=UPI003828DA76